MFDNEFAEVGDASVGIGDAVYTSWLENVGPAIFIKACGCTLHHFLNLVGPFGDPFMDELVKIWLGANGTEALEAGRVVNSHRYHYNVESWTVWHVSAVGGDG